MLYVHVEEVPGIQERTITSTTTTTTPVPGDVTSTRSTTDTSHTTTTENASATTSTTTPPTTTFPVRTEADATKNVLREPTDKIVTSQEDSTSKHAHVTLIDVIVTCTAIVLIAVLALVLTVCFYYHKVFKPRLTAQTPNAIPLMNLNNTDGPPAGDAQEGAAFVETVVDETRAQDQLPNGRSSTSEEPGREPQEHQDETQDGSDELADETTAPQSPCMDVTRNEDGTISGVLMSVSGKFVGGQENEVLLQGSPDYSGYLYRSFETQSKQNKIFPLIFHFNLNIPLSLQGLIWTHLHRRHRIPRLP